MELAMLNKEALVEHASNVKPKITKEFLSKACAEKADELLKDNIGGIETPLTRRVDSQCVVSAVEKTLQRNVEQNQKGRRRTNQES